MFSCLCRTVVANLCKETPPLLQDCIPGLAFELREEICGLQLWCALVVSKAALLLGNHYIVCFSLQTGQGKLRRTEAVSEGWCRQRGQPWLSKGDGSNAAVVVRRAGASPGTC